MGFDIRVSSFQTTLSQHFARYLVVHVLLLLEYPTLNGGENSLLCLLPRVQAAGVRLTAAAPATGALADALTEVGVELISLHRSPESSQTDRRNHLSRLIRQVRPSLVHANSLSMSRLVGPVCRDLSIASLGHLRDMMRLSQLAITDLNQHKRLLAVSEATRQWYCDLGVSSQRLHVLYNGVDTERFRPRPATGYLHRELKLDRATMLIGSIGQLGMRKGLDLLVAAAKQIVQRHSNVCFVVVGERHSQKSEAIAYEQSLRECAREQLFDNLRFLGRREDVARILPELTLLVHLARQEPLGRVLLEGAASGCCILATDVGGTSEIFPPDEKAAYLIQPDARAAFRAMDVLLKDDSNRQQMATMARRRAETVFRVCDSADHLLHHYDAVFSVH